MPPMMPRRSQLAAFFTRLPARSHTFCPPQIKTDRKVPLTRSRFSKGPQTARSRCKTTSPIAAKTTQQQARRVSSATQQSRKRMRPSGTHHTLGTERRISALFWTTQQRNATQRNNNPRVNGIEILKKPRLIFRYKPHELYLRTPDNPGPPIPISSRAPRPR